MTTDFIICIGFMLFLKIKWSMMLGYNIEICFAMDEL